MLWAERGVAWEMVAPVEGDTSRQASAEALVGSLVFPCEEERGMESGKTRR